MIRDVPDASRPVIRNIEDFDHASGSFAERMLFNHRRIVIGLCVVVTALLGAQITKLRLNAGFDKMIPAQHPYVINYRAHQRDLHGVGNAVRIAVETTTGTIYEAPYLETLRQINDEVLLIAGVDRSYARSLWTPSTRWLSVTEEGLEGGPVIADDYDGSAAKLQQVRANVERSGVIGHLVAANERSSVLLLPLLERQSRTGLPLDYRRFARDLEQVRARFETSTIRLHVTGFAQVVGDLMAGLNEMLRFFAIAPPIAVLVLYGYTRCARCSLLVVLCSVVAVVWLLGLLPTLGLELDPYSLLIPYLIFAIGVSHGAQKMNGITRDIGLGTHRLVAARYTFRRLFSAGLTALLAAAAGFAVLMVIPIPVIRHMTLAAIVGVAALLFTNLMLLPVLLSYVGVSAGAAARGARSAREDDLRKALALHPVLWSFAGFTRPRWAALALGSALVLAGAAIIVGRRLEVGDLQPGAPELRPDSRYNRDSAFMTANYGASTDQLVLMVKTPPYQCAAYRTVVAIDALEWRLRQMVGVESTSSLAGLSRRMAAGLNEGSLKWYDVPRNQDLLNAVAARSPRELVDDDCDLLIVSVYLGDHRAATLTRVVAAIETFAAANHRVDAQFLLAAGNAGLEAATNMVVERANRRMLVLVFAAVIALMVSTFRSGRAVLCVVLPLALTAVLCEALMVLLGVGVKVATLPVIAVGVGIGVDYGLYLLTVTLAHLRQGLPLQDAYARALLFTGRVVILAGVTLGFAVATWTLSDIELQADMGRLLAFMFTWNMLATLVLLPALGRLLLRPRVLSP